MEMCDLASGGTRGALSQRRCVSWGLAEVFCRDARGEDSSRRGFRREEKSEG